MSAHAHDFPAEYADWKNEYDLEETTLGFTAWMALRHDVHLDDD